MKTLARLTFTLGLLTLLAACSAATPAQVRINAPSGDFSTKGTTYLLIEMSAKK
ncbi:MAG: hypothetical protein ACAI44_10045 [Candidatus Sericytochromatia bacterium]